MDAWFRRCDGAQPGRAAPDPGRPPGRGRRAALGGGARGVPVGGPAFLEQAAVRAGTAVSHLRVFRHNRQVALDLQHALLPEVPTGLPGVDVAVRYQAGGPGRRDRRGLVGRLRPRRRPHRHRPRRRGRPGRAGGGRHGPGPVGDAGRRPGRTCRRPRCWSCSTGSWPGCSRPPARRGAGARGSPLRSTPCSTRRRRRCGWPTPAIRPCSSAIPEPRRPRCRRGRGRRSGCGCRRTTSSRCRSPPGRCWSASPTGWSSRVGSGCHGGLERLAAYLDQLAEDEDVQSIADGALRCMAEFVDLHDDIALVVLRSNPAPRAGRPAGQLTGPNSAPGAGPGRAPARRR